MPLDVEAFLVRTAKEAVPLKPFTTDVLQPWLTRQSSDTQKWVRRLGFTGAAGSTCLLPGADGSLAGVLAGIDPEPGPWRYAHLPGALPPGTYRIDGKLSEEEANHAALGWALAGYVFDKYKRVDTRAVRLVWPEKADAAAVARTARGIARVRDLINIPTEDMGPAQLAEEARAIAKAHGAKVTVTVGDMLLRKNYPAIHAVGRASSQEPRLIDLRWEGSARGPRITLVGKGVVFDSGGLDIKPAAAMKTMKKDMGGAAHVLALAEMVMSARLPLRLRVLVPAVENAIAGNAFRPLDVIRTRKGLTIEIGNTDAEGRLILCDALAEAAAEDPDLLIDFATLTGAARIALGPDLPALFTNHEPTAKRLEVLAEEERDPVWRLPLFKPYRKMLETPVADLNNSPEGGLGGAITAGLFLAEFVPATIPWVHLDIMAWNQAPRPGRPAGGEASALRAVYRLIAERARPRGRSGSGRGRKAGTSRRASGRR